MGTIKSIVQMENAQEKLAKKFKKRIDEMKENSKKQLRLNLLVNKIFTPFATLMMSAHFALVLEFYTTGFYAQAFTMSLTYLFCAYCMYQVFKQSKSCKNKLEEWRVVENE